MIRKYFALSAILLVLSIPSFAQTEAEATEAFTKGAALLQAGRFKDAIPLLATAAKGFPDDPDVRMGYGLALVLGAKQADDAAEAKKLSDQALTEFQAAKRLGSKEPEVDLFIKLLSGDTSALQASSPTAASPGDKYLQQAEALFTQSRYEEAAKMYQKALDADPKLYQAALYLGDSYVSLGDYDNAEKAYQKAIAIDPLRETAYRYSATPLMKQKKYDAARDRYIEAFITEPYSDLSSRGITQWAAATGAKLSHPVVSIPEIKYAGTGKPEVVMDAASPASKAWLAYALSRKNWHDEKFAKTFPGEQVYRHSLAEEADSIRATLKSAREQKLSHPDFDVLQKLDDAGLLDAFILMAQADKGIAADHSAYLQNNRQKLRQYVLNYVIKK